CTGSLGGAAAELLALQRAPGRFAKLVKTTDDHPHLFPQPRIAVAARIRSADTAAIDISVGLSNVMGSLYYESDLNEELDAAVLPVQRIALEVERGEIVRSALELALQGGD